MLHNPIPWLHPLLGCMCPGISFHDFRQSAFVFRRTGEQIRFCTHINKVHTQVHIHTDTPVQEHTPAVNGVQRACIIAFLCMLAACKCLIAGFHNFVTIIRHVYCVCTEFQCVSDEKYTFALYFSPVLYTPLNLDAAPSKLSTSIMSRCCSVDGSFVTSV